MKCLGKCVSSGKMAHSFAYEKQADEAEILI